LAIAVNVTTKASGLLSTFTEGVKLIVKVFPAAEVPTPATGLIKPGPPTKPKPAGSVRLPLDTRLCEFKSKWK
jgi:hypothetical protein